MTEIINASRVKAYSALLGLSFVKGEALDTSDDLYSMLGEEDQYTSPIMDNAPWFDPDIPESEQFAGLVPLEISGIEDSTRSSEITEYTSDGGNPGSLRHSTKTVVFTAALVGASEDAVEYGFRWLKRALIQRQCVPGTNIPCRGADLYFSRALPVAKMPVGHSEPIYGIIDGGGPSDSFLFVVDGGSPYGFGEASPVNRQQWLTDYQRHLRNVKFSRGPIVTGKRKFPGCGGVMWLVSFTAVAGDPFTYSAAEVILRGLGDPTVTDPYSEGYTGTKGANTYTAEPCPVAIYTPVYDPQCTALVAPPGPPNLRIGCSAPPSGSWARRYAEIPASAIPLWDEVAPTIYLTAGADADVRDVRVQIFEGSVGPAANCGAVGEFYVTYIPAGMTLTLDVGRQRAYITDEYGYSRTADSLILGANNAPVTWFSLSCGDAYVVTVENAVSAPTVVSLGLDLIGRTA